MPTRQSRGMFLALMGWCSLAHGQATDTNSTPPSSSTPAFTDQMGRQLLDACSQGNLDQVKALLSQGVPLNAHLGSYGNTPLISSSSHIEVTRYLLSLGAKVNEVDNLGNSALADACYYSHDDVAEALLDAGADPNLGNKNSRFPLMYAAEKGDETLAKLLLDHHANVNSDNDAGTAFNRALENDQTGIMKLLIQAGADLKLEPQPLLPDRRFWTLLGIAAENGHVDAMEILLQQGINVNDCGEDGTSALMMAVAANKADATTWLLAHGADINHQDEKGRTALNFALQHAGPAIPQALLAAHADVNLATKDGVTPLMVAVQFQLEPIWTALLRDGAKLEAKDEAGRTALMIACLHFYEPAVEFLVGHGADVNATDAQGETALTYAGDRAEMDGVAFLKAHGAQRTDLHIIAKEKPNPPLSPDRTWALAVGAIYAQVDGENPNLLGYGRQAEESREQLKSGWDVTDGPSFLLRAQRLHDTGHRADFLRIGTAVAGLSDLQLSVLTTMAPLPKLIAARKNYLKWKERTGLAWDYCRYVNLMNLGYSAGYISDWEAWGLITSAAAEMHAKFSSWQEMSDNFLDGRETWAGERDPRFEACSNLLLNPKDPNSPWTENPWSAGPAP